MAHELSCSVACGIFPDQGSNPCPLHWQVDSQPLRHQRSPSKPLLYERKTDLSFKFPLSWTCYHLQLNLTGTDTKCHAEVQGPLLPLRRVEAHWIKAARWLRGERGLKSSLPSPFQAVTRAVFTRRLRCLRPCGRGKHCLESRLYS